MDTWLRIIGIAFSLSGTLLLAWRAKLLYESLEKAHYIFEANFRVLKNYMDGKSQNIPYTVGSNVFVEAFQPYSKFMFMFSIILIAVGNGLVGVSWYFTGINN